jgi:hypothetical protein
MRQDNAALGFYICPTTSANVFSRTALARMDLQAMDGRGAFDGSPALAMPYLGEIISLNEPLAYYRVHASSISGWNKPTVALLQRELTLFEKSWSEVVRALGMPAVPFNGVPPLYVREREMMMAALRNQAFIVPQVWRFLCGIPRTHLPPKQKLVLAGWALGLLVPSAGLRESLIRSKRSSANRSRRLRAIINFVTGARAA